MRVTFDECRGCWFPLSAREVRSVLRSEVAPDILERIAWVRFGCSTRTGQEGRVVERGTRYDIRIDFCPHESGDGVLFTRRLSERREWTEPVRSLGGRFDPGTPTVIWSVESAARYAVFLLLHEVAHIVFNVSRRGGFCGTSRDPAEEVWCDSFAMRRARTYTRK